MTEWQFSADIDEDGDMTLEWYANKGNVVTVSFSSARHEINWAALIEGVSNSGHVRLTAEIERIDRASNAPRHDASAASLPNAEGSEKIGQPLSAEDRATVEQYLADVTCPECHCPKHMHRPGCSASIQEAKP